MNLWSTQVHRLFKLDLCPSIERKRLEVYKVVFYFILGFTKSRSKALQWYEKAADHGDEEAQKRLQHLLQRPQESKNLMHPILRDILMWSLFNTKPEEKKQFHKSKSAPNLRENSHNLNLQVKGSPNIDFRQQEISEDVSSSVSCGLQMSEYTSSCSDLSIGLV